MLSYLITLDSAISIPTHSVNIIQNQHENLNTLSLLEIATKSQRNRKLGSYVGYTEKQDGPDLNIFNHRID